MAKRKRKSSRRASTACRTYHIKGHKVRLSRNKKGQFKACR